MSLNTNTGRILLEGLSSQNAAIIAIILLAAIILIILIISLANRSREDAPPSAPPSSPPARPTVTGTMAPKPVAPTTPVTPKVLPDPNPMPEPRKITLDEIFAQKNHLWVCPRCETLHPYTRERCFICGYERSH